MWTGQPHNDVHSSSCSNGNRNPRKLWPRPTTNTHEDSEIAPARNSHAHVFIVCCTLCCGTCPESHNRNTLWKHRRPSYFAGRYSLQRPAPGRHTDPAGRLERPPKAPVASRTPCPFIPILTAAVPGSVFKSRIQSGYKNRPNSA